MENLDAFIEEATTSSEKPKSGIFEKNNKYYYCKIDDTGNPTYRKLSNFTITIIASHYREDGIYREIVFCQGEHKSSKFLIAPESMFDRFKIFLSGCGNYSWWGNTIDLTNLWNYLYQRDTGKVIYEPDCIGWQEQYKIYMFENVAISDKGSILLPDNEGTYWLDGKGIRPRSLNIKSDSIEGVPSLECTDTIDINTIRQMLSDTMEPSHADQCLGWCASVLFMEEIFHHFGNFPFLFISGKRGTGKSTIAQWLTYLFGLDGSGRMWSDTTQVAIGRYLSYYSALPMWLDEYRNDAKYSFKNGLLRDVFNRHVAGKGNRTGFGVREDRIRGTLIVSGEETPQDNALLTRCIIIPMTKHHRRVNRFNWFSENRMLLSSFAFQILKNKHNTKDQYIKSLFANKESLSRLGFDERLSINKAIVATGFELLFGEDKSFASSLISNTKLDAQDQDEESAISVFFNDVAALLFAKSISENYLVNKDGFLYIYFHGLYNEWAIDYRQRRGEPPFKLQSLRGYMTDEPGYISSSINTRMNDGSVRSCVKFKTDEANSYIRQLIKEGA